MKQEELVTDKEHHTSLTINIEGSSISFEKFRKVQKELATIFNEIEQTLLISEVESTLTKGKPPSVNWIISSVESGSIHLTLKGVPSEKVKNKDIAKVISVIESGITTIAERPERPPFFSDRALKSTKALANLVKKDVVMIELKINSHKVNFNKHLMANVDAILEGNYKSHGSIQGVIKTIDLSQKEPFFRLFNLLKNQGIRCYFNSYLLDSIKNALGKRVSVYGLIISTKDGEKVSIKVEEMEVLPSEDDLPSIEDMIGILGG